jgi:hypothetical protein
MSDFSAFSVVDLVPDAMARTHFISNQLASPIVVANSTATCPKTMKYRNGFIRIVTAALVLPPFDRTPGYVA